MTLTALALQAVSALRPSTAKMFSMKTEALRTNTKTSSKEISQAPTITE